MAARTFRIMKLLRRIFFFCVMEYWMCAEKSLTSNLKSILQVTELWVKRQLWRKQQPSYLARIRLQICYNWLGQSSKSIQPDCKSVFGSSGLCTSLPIMSWRGSFHLDDVTWLGGADIRAPLRALNSVPPPKDIYFRVLPCDVQNIICMVRIRFSVFAIICIRKK